MWIGRGVGKFCARQGPGQETGKSEGWLVVGRQLLDFDLIIGRLNLVLIHSTQFKEILREMADLLRMVLVMFYLCTAQILGD